MKTKARVGNSTNESCLELKYCERCGGLWLRPVGGGQIYCTGCGREMAKLPPASTEAEMVRVQRGPRWAEDGGDFIRWDGDEEVDLDAAAGGA